MRVDITAAHILLRPIHASWVFHGGRLPKGLRDVRWSVIMALGTSWPNPRGSMMATHYKFPKGLLIGKWQKSTNKWTIMAWHGKWTNRHFKYRGSLIRYTLVGSNYFLKSTLKSKTRKVCLPSHFTAGQKMLKCPVSRKNSFWIFSMKIK